MLREYVVDFKLPSDTDMFMHHGLNVCAKNVKEAEAMFKHHYPSATILKTYLGIVCLYGDEYATWDSAGGAEASPWKSGRRIA